MIESRVEAFAKCFCLILDLLQHALDFFIAEAIWLTDHLRLGTACGYEKYEGES
jgi:hypothetical protein